MYLITHCSHALSSTGTTYCCQHYLWPPNRRNPSFLHHFPLGSHDLEPFDQISNPSTDQTGWFHNLYTSHNLIPINHILDISLDILTSFTLWHILLTFYDKFFIYFSAIISTSSISLQATEFLYLTTTSFKCHSCSPIPVY